MFLDAQQPATTTEVPAALLRDLPPANGHNAANEPREARRAASAPPRIQVHRRRVLHRLLVLYRHVFGLMAGAHVAHVRALPPHKRKYLRSAGSRFLAFCLHFFLKKELRDLPFAAQLRLRLELLGPTYVKLGQIMAIREDILPKAITTELKKLLDHLPEVPFQQIQEIIEQSLGAPIENLFLEIHPEALGSASIAQTHLAKTLLGDTVVLKVIKPGIREAILSDLKLMQILARLLEWLIPHYQPQVIINEFCAYTEKEIDLTCEADHAEIFAANFANHPDIVFPKIYRRLSTKEVLCMAYLEGLKPSDPKVRELSSEEVHRLLDLGTGAIIKMLYADGFFHADLHTGNLVVLPGPKVGFIDVGMVGRFDEKMKLYMLYYFYALVNGDVENSSKYLLAMATIDAKGDALGFKRAVSDLFRRYLLHASDGRTSLAQLILESLKIGGKFHIFFPVEMTLMVKALVTFEGVGLQLDPKLDIPQLSRKHIREIYANHYDPTALIGQFLRGLPELVDVMVRLPEMISSGSRFLEHLFNRPTYENPLVGMKSSLMAGSCIIGGVIAFGYGAPPVLWVGLFISSVIFFFFGK